MFYLNKCKKGLWLFLAIATVVVQTACEKNDNLGAPVITGLRAISPAPDDSMLTHVLPGQIVVVQGKHFNETQHIFFNGYEASINPALNTNHSMVVTVPSGIVFGDIPEDKMNVVRLVTPHGETSFQIPVVPPKPIIYSIDNEYAHGGDEILLTGSYLYAIQKIVFPGGISVSDNYTSINNGNGLRVTVPEGIVPGNTDSIEVVTSGGSGKFTFNNTSGIIANFENGDPNFGWAYWDATLGSDASKFPGIVGTQYVEILNSSVGAGNTSWWTGNRAVITTQTEWGNVTLSDKPENYALKFQLYVKNEWSTGELVVATSAMRDNGTYTYLARYAPWENESDGSFKTTHWITVTIPMDEFLETESSGAYASTNNPAETMQQLMGGNKSIIQIMLYNLSDITLENFDAAFDNLRIVKIN